MHQFQSTLELIRPTHLFIDIRDVLLSLPVHVEDLKESFVDALVIRKACLHGPSEIEGVSGKLVVFPDTMRFCSTLARTLVIFPNLIVPY